MGEPCMNTKIQIYLGKERKGKKKENQRKKEKKRGPCTLRKGENFRKKGVCEDEEETSLWQVATHQPLILAIQIFKNTSFSGRIFIFFPTDVLSPSLPPS